VRRVQSALLASAPHQLGIAELSGLLLGDAVNATTARE
jgi:hypothetical protein